MSNEDLFDLGEAAPQEMPAPPAPKGRSRKATAPTDEPPPVKAVDPRSQWPTILIDHEKGKPN